MSSSKSSLLLNAITCISDKELDDLLDASVHLVRDADRTKCELAMQTHVIQMEKLRRSKLTMDKKKENKPIHVDPMEAMLHRVSKRDTAFVTPDYSTFSVPHIPQIVARQVRTGDTIPLLPPRIKLNQHYIAYRN